MNRVLKLASKPSPFNGIKPPQKKARVSIDHGPCKISFASATRLSRRRRDPCLHAEVTAFTDLLCYLGVTARTFRVLAMTGWENGFFFYIGIWAGSDKNI
jgi:hypothetical protein